MEGSTKDMRIDGGTYPLYERVRQDHAVSVYIGEQNKSMKALHYTEHSFAHVGIVTQSVSAPILPYEESIVRIYP